MYGGFEMDIKLIGQKTYLTPLKESDIQTITNWSIDPLLCNTYHNFISLKEPYLKSYMESPKENQKIYLINTMDNIVIGKLSVDIDENDNCACIEMVIAEKVYTGKGYGKDALRTIIKYCFEDLNLDCIKMTFKENNMRAEYCCWGCGLREDKYYLPNNESTNTSRMVIYKKDYIGF